MDGPDALGTLIQGGGRGGGGRGGRGGEGRRGSSAILSLQCEGKVVTFTCVRRALEL